MPGRRRRRERQEREWQRRKALEAAAGPWATVFTTRDEQHVRTFHRWLAEQRLGGLPGVDWRFDRYCGRGVHPTTYAVRCRFLPVE